MGKSNTEMAKQFLKQASSFCSLFEQLAWVHLLKPITAGLPRRYMPDVIFLTLGLSAAELISLWKGMMSTVLLLDLLFLHKYTKLDCQQCVYCATDLYNGSNPMELPWKFSGRTYASCVLSWELNATSDWVFFCSRLPLLDWEFEGGLCLFECASSLLVLGCLTLFLLLVKWISVYFFSFAEELPCVSRLRAEWKCHHWNQNQTHSSLSLPMLSIPQVS